MVKKEEDGGGKEDRMERIMRSDSDEKDLEVIDWERFEDVKVWKMVWIEGVLY